MTTSTGMAVNFINEQRKRIVTESQGSRLWMLTVNLGETFLNCVGWKNIFSGMEKKCTNILATLTYTICFKRSYVDETIKNHHATCSWIISSEKSGRIFTMLKACWIKIWEDVETGLSWFRFETIGSRDDRFSNLRSTWSWSKRLWKRGEIYGKKIWENLHLPRI